MWTLDTYPPTVKLEITIEDLAQAGPTEAFIRVCKKTWPDHIYKPSLRSLELRIFDKKTVELVAIYRLPPEIRSVFNHNYRPTAVTLYLGRLKVK